MNFKVQCLTECYICLFQVTVLRAEVSEAGSQKERIEKLENEKLLLEDKVAKLETSLQDVQQQTQNRWEKSSNPGDLDEDGEWSV